MENTKSELRTSDPLSLNGARHDIQTMQDIQDLPDMQDIQVLPALQDVEDLSDDFQDIQATPQRIPVVLLDEHKKTGLESSKTTVTVAKKKGVPSSKELAGRKMSALLRERCRQ